MRFMLVSITVLFAAIFLVYYLRSRHPVNWERVPMPNLLWASTAHHAVQQLDSRARSQGLFIMIE